MSFHHLRVWTMVAACAVWMTPAAAFAADAEAGKAPFMANCMSCHGETGMGDGPVGAVLDPRPRNFQDGDFKFDTDGDGTKGSDADLKNVIRNGGAQYGGSPLMAPWPTLSDEEVDNIIAYIRSLKK